MRLKKSWVLVFGLASIDLSFATFGPHVQPVRKIMYEGQYRDLVFFILHAFSSLESEGVSAYAMTRQNLLYSLIQSMDVSQRGSMWYI